MKGHTVQSQDGDSGLWDSLQNLYKVLAFLHDIAHRGGGVCSVGPQLLGGGMFRGLRLP